MTGSTNKIKRKTISVTVSRTIQVQQFQPSVVTVTETTELGPDDNPEEVKAVLYKSASRSVTKFMNAEIDKYSGDE